MALIDCGPFRTLECQDRQQTVWNKRRKKIAYNSNQFLFNRQSEFVDVEWRFWLERRYNRDSIYPPTKFLKRRMLRATWGCCYTMRIVSTTWLCYLVGRRWQCGVFSVWRGWTLAPIIAIIPESICWASPLTKFNRVKLALKIVRLSNQIDLYHLVLTCILRCSLKRRNKNCW